MYFSPCRRSPAASFRQKRVHLPSLLPHRQSERKPAPDWVGNGRDCRYVGKTAFSWVLPPAPPFHVCNNMSRGRKLPCVLPIKAVLKIECLGRYAQRPTVLGPLSRTRDASALPGRHRGALCAGTSGWWGCGRESSTTALQYFAIHNSICSKRIIRKYNLESVQSVLSQEGAFWLKGMESQHDPLSAE